MFFRKPGFWFFQIGGWTFYGLFNYIQVGLGFRNNDFEGWLTHLAIGFLLTLGLRVVYRHFMRKNLPFLKLGLIAVLGTIVISVVWFFLSGFIVDWWWGASLNEHAFREQFKDILVILWTCIYLAIPMFGWSILYFAIKFWMKILDEKEKTEKSLLLAQQAQLQMLRYQLNPHFLFNSLNSIQALIYIDQVKADKMLTDLSEFLRFSLANKDKIDVPLQEEIQMIQKYLSMEKTRYPNRLEYAIEVSEEAMRQTVISFLLQPFVENAIKYGLRGNPDYLKIGIRGEVRGYELHIEISNSGKWVEPENDMGTGMQNVIKRLENAYPNKYRFNIRKLPDLVIISIRITPIDHEIDSLHR